MSNDQSLKKHNKVITENVHIERQSLRLSDKVSIMTQNLPDGAIGFLIGEDGQPMIVREKSQLNLGRFGERGNTDRLYVDLSQYGAVEFGVSRKHAEILISEDEFMLQDLESTNGTYINDKRLTSFTPHLLASGDEIRLGNLPMVVVFKDKEMLARRQVLILNDLNPGRDSVTLMSDRIVPFVKSLETLQALATGQAAEHQTSIQIKAVSFDGPRIVIEVEGASKAVRIVEESLEVFRKNHPDIVKQIAEDRLDPTDMRLFELIDSLEEWLSSRAFTSSEHKTAALMELIVAYFSLELSIHSK